MNKKLIKCMDLDEIFFDYKPVLHEDEKVIFKNNSLYVQYKGKEEQLTEDDIVCIQKDSLAEVRRHSSLTTNERVEAIFNMEDPYYRLAIVKDEDLVDISYQEMITILTSYTDKHDEISFEYTAYREENEV